MYKNLCGLFLGDFSDGCAKRLNGKFCELKALFAEGDTDNGYAPNYTAQKEAEGKEKTTENNPDYVRNRMLAEIRLCFVAERPDYKFCDFEALFTKRNTDYGDAPNNPDEKPSNRLK